MKYLIVGCFVAIIMATVCTEVQADPIQSVGSVNPAEFNLAFNPIGGVFPSYIGTNAGFDVLTGDDFQIGVGFWNLEDDSPLEMFGGTNYGPLGEANLVPGSSKLAGRIHISTPFSNWQSVEVFSPAGNSFDLKNSFPGNTELRQWMVELTAAFPGIDLEVPGNYELSVILTDFQGTSYSATANLAFGQEVPSGQDGGDNGTDPVPEPGTLALFGVAALGYVFYRRRKTPTV